VPCTEGKGGPSALALRAGASGRASFDTPAAGTARVEFQDAGTSPSPTTWKKSLAWDLVLGLAAAVYLDLVLFQGFEIPLLGFAWIAVAGTRIVDLHRTS